MSGLILQTAEIGNRQELQFHRVDTPSKRHSHFQNSVSAFSNTSISQNFWLPGNLGKSYCLDVCLFVLSVGCRVE